jgi:hypothetical protein
MFSDTNNEIWNSLKDLWFQYEAAKLEAHEVQRPWYSRAQLYKISEYDKLQV